MADSCDPNLRIRQSQNIRATYCHGPASCPSLRKVKPVGQVHVGCHLINQTPTLKNLKLLLNICPLCNQNRLTGSGKILNSPLLHSADCWFSGIPKCFGKR